MRFAMFYPDDTLYDDGTNVEVTWTVPRVWYEAPKDGLQAVVVLSSPHQVHRGLDIYCTLPGGEIVGTNDLGPIMRAAGLAKYGLYIPRVEYEQVNARVQAFREERDG